MARAIKFDITRREAAALLDHLPGWLEGSRTELSPDERLILEELIAGLAEFFGVTK